MPIENPYRSAHVSEARVQSKKAVPSFLSCSRTLIVMFLLVFTAVTFYIHEIRYGGLSADRSGDPWSKIGLSRLRGKSSSPASLAGAAATKEESVGAVNEKNSADHHTDLQGSHKSVTNTLHTGEPDGGGGSHGGGSTLSNPPVPTIDSAVPDAGENTNKEAAAGFAHHHTIIHKVNPHATDTAQKPGGLEHQQTKPVVDKQPERKINVATKKENEAVSAKPNLSVPAVPVKSAKGGVDHVQGGSSGVGGIEHLDEAPGAGSRGRRHSNDHAVHAANSDPGAHTGVVLPTPTPNPTHLKSVRKQEGTSTGGEGAKQPPVVHDAFAPKPHNVDASLRPPNPYDLKPSAKKRAAEKILKQEQLRALQLEHMKCDGSFDPFEGLPIESFEPPANAKVKDKMAWKSHVRDMMHRVKAQKVGGKALRAFMDEEVEKLQLERMSLFCEALLESKISK